MHRLFGDGNIDYKTNTSVDGCPAAANVPCCSGSFVRSATAANGRKTFADIVRKKNDSRTDHRNSPTTVAPIGSSRAAGEANANFGCDFRGIDNSSVRSVLKNVLEDPDQKTNANPDRGYVSWPRDLRNTANDCINCAHQVDGTSQVARALDQLVSASASCAAQSSHVTDLLSTLLCRRFRQLAASRRSFAPLFVCPRCGETADLDVLLRLDGLGSVGDRCVANLRSRFQDRGCSSGQYSRTHDVAVSQHQSSGQIAGPPGTRCKPIKANPEFGRLNSKKNKRETKRA